MTENKNKKRLYFCIFRFFFFVKKNLFFSFVQFHYFILFSMGNGPTWNENENSRNIFRSKWMVVSSNWTFAWVFHKKWKKLWRLRRKKSRRVEKKSTKSRTKMKYPWNGRSLNSIASFICRVVGGRLQAKLAY